MQHDFIKNAQPTAILQKMILEAKEIQEEQTLNTMNGDESVSLVTSIDLFLLFTNRNTGTHTNIAFTFSR